MDIFKLLDECDKICEGWTTEYQKTANQQFREIEENLKDIRTIAEKNRNRIDHLKIKGIDIDQAFYHTGRAKVRYSDIDIDLFHTRYNVLDVGCADGLVTSIVNGLVNSIKGIDINPHRIAIAKTYYPEIGFSVENIVEYDIGEYYDLILFLGVYHHISKGERNNVLRKILKATKTVIMRTPLNDMRINDILEVSASENYKMDIQYSKNEGVGDLIILERK